MLNEIKELSQAELNEAVEWRRNLHQHPELAYNEFRTADLVADKLASFGYEVNRELACTGVVGTLKRGTSSRVIGIRADMDALRIKEENDVPHASSLPGIMHACGHDGHVAVALAAARACSRLDDIDGTIRFIFQPAEENAGGARRMIEDGLFEKFPCDAIFGLHCWPGLEVGACAVPSGAMFAAVGLFEITISGQGCHGALPHQGTDCLLAGSHLVTSLQSIASRNVDPIKAVVVSATQFHAGSASNAIADHCVIGGTTRWFDAEAGKIVEKRLCELAHSIAAAFNCTATISYRHHTPSTINDEKSAERVRNIIRDKLPDLNLDVFQPVTGAEDFSYMLQKVPGCFLLLGTKGRQAGPVLHSPFFDFNDDALPVGVKLWVEIVRNYLGREDIATNSIDVVNPPFREDRTELK
jgi:hippurate hydrolase